MAGSQADASRPWRVGVLFSTTGSMAVIEETQLRGTLQAICEINARGGVLGREIVPVAYDPGSDTRMFARYASRLILDDDVTAIFGCYTSSSRKAVLPVVERLNALLFYPTLYEGFEFSPNIIYTGAAPNQNSVALCTYVMKHCGHRVHVVGSDYCYPHEANRLMRELVRSNGGEVVGESYVGLRAGPRDFAPIMRDIRDARPDVVFSTVVGDATTHLYQAYAAAGFDPKIMPIASLTTTEAELRAMGHDVGENHVTAAPYFQSVQGERNTAFVAGYKALYGDAATTNMCAEAAYFQVHIWAAALAQTGSADADLLRPMILGSSFDAPQGAVAINRLCHHADLWTRIGRANRHGQFDIVEQSAGAIVADPYLVGYGSSVFCQ